MEYVLRGSGMITRPDGSEERAETVYVCFYEVENKGANISISPQLDAALLFQEDRIERGNVIYHVKESYPEYSWEYVEAVPYEETDMGKAHKRLEEACQLSSKELSLKQLYAQLTEEYHAIQETLVRILTLCAMERKTLAHTMTVRALEDLIDVRYNIESLEMHINKCEEDEEDISF